MEVDKKEGDLNDNKLVTVAIHTYEKAQILKTILEYEGIESVIHGINIIEPSVPGSVRVRIREKDLQNALRIIEQVDFTSKLDEDLEELEISNNEILIPVDFSDYTMSTCEFGFKLANDLNCKVKLIHAFFTPFYPAAIPFSDAFTLPAATDKDLYKDVKKKTENEMKALQTKIEEAISKGFIPKVSYSTVLTEGLPEEEIITYSKKMKPVAIVMGTKGKNAKELDLIGSVTAEVMDGCKTPIFAVPEEAKVRNISDIRKIVFLTNFQEREFKALDIMIKFFNKYPIKLYLAHIAKKDDVWNQIKLSGFQKFLSEKYPHIDTEYSLIDQASNLEVSIEQFVEEKKIDMISLSSSRRNIFARMFNPGIARRMLFHSDTTILVIKGLG